MKEYGLKDSGERQDFITGSRRDTQRGKSRPDLIWEGWLRRIDPFMTGGYSRERGEQRILYDIMVLPERDIRGVIYGIEAISMQLIKHEFPLAETAYYPPMLLRLGHHLAKGAEKYGEHNWRLGQPLKRFYQSMTRHAVQYFIGESDEDHFSAALFGLMGMYYMIYTCDPKDPLVEWGINNVPA